MLLAVDIALPLLPDPSLAMVYGAVGGGHGGGEGGGKRRRMDKGGGVAPSIDL